MGDYVQLTSRADHSPSLKYVAAR